MRISVVRCELKDPLKSHCLDLLAFLEDDAGFTPKKAGLIMKTLNGAGIYTYIYPLNLGK